MRGLSIMRAQPVSAVAVSAGDGGQYLHTPDPKEVWSVGLGSTLTVDIDLGASQPVDTIFLGYTNAKAGTQWRIQRTSSLAGASPVEIVPQSEFSLAAGIDPRRHGLALLGSAVTTRYLRITIYPADSGSFTAGIVAAGKRFDHAYEYKAGRRPIDLSERVDLAGGGFGLGIAAIKSSFKFTFSDLNDNEIKALWTLVRQTGNQAPVLLVEGGDGPIDQEMVHYGLFERFEAYEREDPADTRWALSMQDWI